MTSSRLTDLDELALRVRNALSRTYIAEAINAYHGGALRSAIVSTWIAVTVDIIAKLRELAGHGDAEAARIITDLDASIESDATRKLQQLEGELLSHALRLEFISRHEHVDLDRLRLDRHLCAHPAFVASDQLFQPTHELVRTHLTHAVLHLLQHQPVQGKAAIARFVHDLGGGWFPTDAEQARAFLEGRYLNRARQSLIVNLTKVLLKALVREAEPDLIGQEPRVITALQAIAFRHRAVYEQTVRETLLPLLTAATTPGLLRAVRLITADPWVWTVLPRAEQIAVTSAVASVDLADASNEHVLAALDVADLAGTALAAVRALSVDDQLALLAAHPRPELNDTAVALFAASSSFRAAEVAGRGVLLPRASTMTRDQVRAVLHAVQSNDQIYLAWQMPPILERLFEATEHHLADLEGEWRTLMESPSGIRPLSQEFRFPGVVERLKARGVPLADAPTDEG